MKLRIGTTLYDVTDAVLHTTLSDLYQLKVQTGIGMATLQKTLNRMGDAEDEIALLDDEDALLAINALIWLCRRRAGEHLTLEQAGAVDIQSVMFIPDEDEDVEAPDPTSAQTVSALGDEQPAAEPTTSL